MSECVRELTIAEEIKSLEIEENVKERILGKVNRLEKAYEKTNDYLFSCHFEMDRLKGAIVEQAKMIFKLADEVRNKSIE